MYLLDTNVVSELRKARSGKANPGVVRWADEVDAAELFVSVITLQELEIGVLLAERKDAAKGALLRSWLHQHVLRSEEHTSELQSLMRISYAVFCLKKKINH